MVATLNAPPAAARLQSSLLWPKSQANADLRVPLSRRPRIRALLPQNQRRPRRNGLPRVRQAVRPEALGRRWARVQGVRILSDRLRQKRSSQEWAERRAVEGFVIEGFVVEGIVVERLIVE